MITSHKTVAFSYNPLDLKFGHTDNLQYLLERRRNQALLQGSLRLFHLQTQYAKSSSLSTTFTVLHYRDTLLSIALSLALRCLQTRDVMYTELTNHASYYWRHYGNNFWADLPLYEDSPNFVPEQGFTGLAGSLAFMLYQHQNSGAGLFPIELLEQMVQYVWADLNLVSLDLPANKQQALFQLAQLEEIPFSHYTELLTGCLLQPYDQVDPVLQPFTLKVRRQMLSLNDWQQLRARWILGEISPELPGLLIELQALINQNSGLRSHALAKVIDPVILETSWQTLRQLLAPSGPTLFYVTLAVEALTVIARQITDTPPIQAVLFRDFLSQSAYSVQRSAWAEHHATVYDAMGALGLFNTLYEAKGLTYRFYLSALQLLQSANPLPATADYRLFDLVL